MPAADALGDSAPRVFMLPDSIIQSSTFALTSCNAGSAPASRILCPQTLHGVMPHAYCSVLGAKLHLASTHRNLSTVAPSLPWQGRRQIVPGSQHASGCRQRLSANLRRPDTVLKSRTHAVGAVLGAQGRREGGAGPRAAQRGGAGGNGSRCCTGPVVKWRYDATDQSTAQCAAVQQAMCHLCWTSRGVHRLQTVSGVKTAATVS
jgi:hypothetical protein